MSQGEHFCHSGETGNGKLGSGKPLPVAQIVLRICNHGNGQAVLSFWSKAKWKACAPPCGSDCPSELQSWEWVRLAKHPQSPCAIRVFPHSHAC
eukprot:1161064-Pelagomonas_calceolata.AAC.11